MVGHLRPVRPLHCQRSRQGDDDPLPDAEQVPPAESLALPGCLMNIRYRDTSVVDSVSCTGAASSTLPAADWPLSASQSSGRGGA